MLLKYNSASPTPFLLSFSPPLLFLLLPLTHNSTISVSLSIYISYYLPPYLSLHWTRFIPQGVTLSRISSYLHEMLQSGRYWRNSVPLPPLYPSNSSLQHGTQEPLSLLHLSPSAFWRRRREVICINYWQKQRINLHWRTKVTRSVHNILPTFCLHNDMPNSGVILLNILVTGPVIVMGQNVILVGHKIAPKMVGHKLPWRWVLFTHRFKC